MKHIVTLLLATSFALGVGAQKAPNLGKTPQMGWSTWNKFQGNINEQIITGIADEIVNSGLRDAGYTYINIDDCWHGKRDQDGFIQPDATKFPQWNEMAGRLSSSAWLETWRLQRLRDGNLWWNARKFRA